MFCQPFETGEPLCSGRAVAFCLLKMITKRGKKRGRRGYRNFEKQLQWIEPGTQHMGILT